MSKAREIADLLDPSGDVVLGALDNLPAGAVPDWDTLLNKPVLAPSATIDTTDASNIASGTIPIARLGAGGTTGNYLRGDGNWVSNCSNHANCATTACTAVSGVNSAGGTVGIWPPVSTQFGACNCGGPTSIENALTNSNSTVTLGVTGTQTTCACQCDCACNC